MDISRAILFLLSVSPLSHSSSCIRAVPILPPLSSYILGMFLKKSHCLLQAGLTRGLPKRDTHYVKSRGSDTLGGPEICCDNAGSPGKSGRLPFEEYYGFLYKIPLLLNYLEFMLEARTFVITRNSNAKNMHWRNLFPHRASSRSTRWRH